MNVSIVVPIHKPDKKIFQKILKNIKNQKFDGKIEIIKVEKNLGLADSLNYGIRKVKYDIIVSLHQDCIPASKEWLEKLVEPLKNKSVVASVSKVELPYELWKNFDIFSRALTAKEQKIITPLIDEKGCAYKKSAIVKVGLFNGKNFRTAGEDFDMYIKLKKIGKIAYPDCKIFHIHKTDFRKRLKKELQYANGFGASVRIYGKEMPSWYIGILKAIPILGLIGFLKFPIIKSRKLFLIYLLLAPLLHFLYVLGFWEGFINKKQTL